MVIRIDTVSRENAASAGKTVPTGARDGVFDALKVVASALIVFLHFQQMTGVTHNGINFYGGRFHFGLVVEFFFILSGLFAERYIQRIEAGLSFKTFYLRRFFRLFPVTALSVLAHVVIHTLRFHALEGTWENSKLSIWKLLLTVLGIQDGWVTTNPKINNPLWYISVLLLCEVLFYFTCFYARRKKIPVLYLHIMLILLGIGIRTYGLNTMFLNVDTARGYVAFFWGVILAGILRTVQPKGIPILISVVVVTGIPVLIWQQSCLVAEGMTYLMVFLFYPALLLLCMAQPVKKLFRYPWISILGAISFDVYVWHENCMELMFYSIQRFGLSISLGRYRTMLAFYLLSCVVGVLSYYLVEKPCGRKIQALLYRLLEEQTDPNVQTG